jgi:hypothetical protein
MSKVARWQSLVLLDKIPPKYYQLNIVAQTQLGMVLIVCEERAISRQFYIGICSIDQESQSGIG